MTICKYQTLWREKEKIQVEGGATGMLTAGYYQFRFRSQGGEDHSHVAIATWTEHPLHPTDISSEPLKAMGRM